MRARAAVIPCLALAAAAACAKARPVEGGTRRCVSWKEKMAGLISEKCSGCHSGPQAAAGYDTSSYTGVLGGGSDAVPDATAGDADSLVLRMLDPAIADATHAPLVNLFPLVREWVVDCQLSFVQSSIHAGGIMNPASGEFHGQLVRAAGFDFSSCQSCHGYDFGGGTAGVSCNSCHADTPTGCTTCHANIRASGSHARHLDRGPLGKSFGCGECHKVPAAYTDAGHIFRADGSLDAPPAEVVLTGLAAWTPPGAVRSAPPAWDPVAATCSNVYCHGAVPADSAATVRHPVWTAPGKGQADCGSCHGLPPNHAGSDAVSACAGCHPRVVDHERRIIDTELHLDGQVELGDPAAGCTGCHGGAAGPAPPRDLTGATAPSAMGVGAHQAHLTGGSLRGPVACNECHRVPAEISSPGHIGGHDVVDPPPADVFPAGGSGGTLAAADGATPAWDPAAGTCASIYCHGGGAKLAAETTAGVDKAPLWTATGGLTCGSSCHGAPPALAPHTPALRRTDCAICHPRTVDPAGNVILAGPPDMVSSAHINGVIDVAP